MPTYALVTTVSLDAISAAVRSGRTGAYVVPDGRGTSVLFDPPARRSARLKHLIGPAVAAARAVSAPAWLLLSQKEFALAGLVTPDGEVSTLEWAADWVPPSDPVEYLSDRKAWDAHCADLAMRYGRPECGAALAEVRNDPTPGQPPVTMSDLLRRVCRVFDLPEAAIGCSMLVQHEPGPRDAIRVDAAARRRWLRGGAAA